ncbi:MAG: hypothetical protein HONBIEJF_01280 [Fimbriimonadaceae bacterium]|nr:hypothetical protein [Fimbriimonadaceae bacterium]
MEVMPLVSRLVVALACPILSPPLLAQPKAAAKPDVKLITASRLKAHLEFIAHDLLEGRDTPSRGLDIAAHYISTQLKLWGVKPGGVDGTFFQPVSIQKPGVDPNKTNLTIHGRAVAIERDFFAQPTQGTANGNLVFVGHGWECPSKGLDPYQGLDVKGKIVVALTGEPAGLTANDLFSGAVKDGIMTYPAAAKRGAAGIIFIASDDMERGWENVVRANMSSPYPSLGDGQLPAGLPTVTVRKSVAADILGGAGLTAASLDEQFKNRKAVPSFALPADVKADVAVGMKRNSTTFNNVIGIIDGTDPKLKAEFVAVGCHYDHVGMDPNRTGDQIYNGADDDGSGTVALLEMAHALAQGTKPKRSVILVWHGGEEKGLWGSQYFVNKPTVPITSIVAQLNIDMIGRSKTPADGQARVGSPNEIFVIGSKMMSTELGQISEKVNAGLHKLSFDYWYDRPNDPEMLFYRSDHYNYAQKGIPIIFYFDGIHADYHQVSDEVSKIDFGKIARVTQTVLATAFEVGMRPTRPKVDKPLKK